MISKFREVDALNHKGFKRNKIVLMNIVEVFLMILFLWQIAGARAHAREPTMKTLCCISRMKIHLSAIPVSKMIASGTSAPRQNWSAIALSADGSKLAATAYNKGSVWTSSDFGKTWSNHKILTLPDVSYGESTDPRPIAMSSDGVTLAVAYRSTIWVSGDSGVVWKQVALELSSQKFSREGSQHFV